MPKTNVMSKKQQFHDALVEQMPEGATHDRETCEFCAATSSASAEGGNVTTFTAEEVEEAVATATAALEARIAAMETAATASEIEAKIEAAKADSAAEVAEVRAQLDTAVLAAEKAERELEATIAYLNETAAAETAAAEAAARKDERIAKVREAANFPEEYLVANADRYAAMSDEDFEDRVAEWASLSPKKEGTPEGGIPKTTVLTADREIASKTENGLDFIREAYGSHLNLRSL